MSMPARRQGDAARPIQRTVWWTSAPPGPDCPALAGDMEVDVAVVGGGFVGLGTALRLARAGVSVAVFEAAEPGEGASGLNAGFVVPNFAKADPDAVVARLGEAAGTALLRAVGASADDVFGTIAEHRLECDAEQVGWMHIAHAPDAADMLRGRVALWRALGRELLYLEAEEARALTGVRSCHGALLDPSGGMLNPLAYARGLARLVVAAGAALHGWTPVTALARDKDRWRLQAGAHRVMARKVLLCTNAFTGGAAGRLGRGVVPLQVYQLATEPLPAPVAQAISPRRIPIADTRANLFTARLTRDNRLISGGMSILPLGAEKRMGRFIAGRLAREFGLVSPPRVEFAWRGAAAMTPDFLPRIMTWGDGLYGAIGCNGRGVALTHVVANALAGLVTEPGRLAVVPVREGNAIPLRALAPAAASLAVLQVRLKDAFAAH